MKICDLFKSGKATLSFEVFPPKADSNFETVKSATEEIAALKPDYMSVTYGAGGGTSDYTASIASNILNNYGVTPIAHLSCITSTKERIETQLSSLKKQGIENILALRGDKLPDAPDFQGPYKYASELVEVIKKHGDFCVGGACYPEGHIESENSHDDILNLKKKVDAGCDFLTTQMFFDNNILYKFLYKIGQAGINVPVVAGIMPVTNVAQIKRICSISGNALPQKFLRIVDRFENDPQALKQAGIAFATEQIIDLFANGINAVHIYSMNKPDVAEQIQANLSEIIK